MKIGLQLYNYSWPGSPENIGSKLSEIAKAADDNNFTSLWVMDHLYQIGQGYGEPHEPMLEGYSTLSYLAGVTKKIKLGLMVGANSYRPPGLLVKTVTTLDVVSGGRAYFGLGTGWYEQEALGMGLLFPKSIKERYERLEETLKITKHLWSGNQSSFDGKYLKLHEPIFVPQPISKPHPPILIGGGGETKTLKLVAKYGDACNLHLGTPLKGYSPWLNEVFKHRSKIIPHKLEVLRRHCRDFERDPEEIEHTVLSTIKVGSDGMKVRDIIDLCRELEALEVDQIIFNMPDVHLIEPITQIGENIIPVVDE